MASKIRRRKDFPLIATRYASDILTVDNLSLTYRLVGGQDTLSSYSAAAISSGIRHGAIRQLVSNSASNGYEVHAPGVAPQKVGAFEDTEDISKLSANLECVLQDKTIGLGHLSEAWPLANSTGGLYSAIETKVRDFSTRPILLFTTTDENIKTVVRVHIVFSAERSITGDVFRQAAYAFYKYNAQHPKAKTRLCIVVYEIRQTPTGVKPSFTIYMYSYKWANHLARVSMLVENRHPGTVVINDLGTDSIEEQTKLDRETYGTLSSAEIVGLRPFGISYEVKNQREAPKVAPRRRSISPKCIVDPTTPGQVLYDYVQVYMHS